MRAPLITIAVLGAGTAALALRSPHVGGSYGMCPLLAVTGLYCAACGILRATHDLATFDIAGAWAMNPLWVLAAPVIVAWLGLWVVRAVLARRALSRGETPRIGGGPSSRWAAGTAIAIVVDSIARNVPAFAPWLVPGGAV